MRASAEGFLAIEGKRPGGCRLKKTGWCLLTVHVPTVMTHPIRPLGEPPGDSHV